jgi:hypothetical protein
MATVGEVAAKLRAIAEQFRETTRHVLTTRVSASEAVAKVRATTQGTGSEMPGDGCGAVEQGNERLEEAATAFNAGVEILERYVANLDGGGAGGGTDPGPRTAPAPEARPTGPPWRSHPPVPDFVPDRPNERCIEETRKVGWPVNRDGVVSARGRLYDVDGRPITGTVKAGTDGPAAKARDLKEPWAGSSPRNGDTKTKWLMGL